MKKLIFPLMAVGLLLTASLAKSQTTDSLRKAVVDSTGRVKKTIAYYAIDGVFVTEEEYKALKTGVSGLIGYGGTAAMKLFGPAYNGNVAMKVTHKNFNSKIMQQLRAKSDSLGLQKFMMKRPGSEYPN